MEEEEDSSAFYFHSLPLLFELFPHEQGLLLSRDEKKKKTRIKESREQIEKWLLYLNIVLYWHILPLQLANLLT